MPVDTLARATASAALAAAGGGPARIVSLTLFTSLPTTTIDSTVSTLVTAGYSVAGFGGGVYVADALANAALAAAYPALCKQSAGGRYFRLVGTEVTVEQAGATGTVGTNDQPAIQQAINYAQNFNIRTVRFTRPAYELWCPARTTDPGVFANDGYPILITKAMKLVGIENRSVLTFRNSLGGSKDTITQTVNAKAWLGGAILFNPATPVDFGIFENLELNGGKTYVAANANADFQDTDKGIHANDGGTGKWKRLELTNIKAYNFGAEIAYLGGDANSVIRASDCEFYFSPQSAWNPTGLGKVFAVNVDAHDCYLASEIISGQGHTYVGCRFANCYNCGTISTQSFNSNYPYTYPFRDTSVMPRWVQYIGTRFENVTQISMGSWTRGSIVMNDCQMVIQANTFDIDLDIEAWTDQKNSNSLVSLSGPPTLTTQIPNAPVGTYFIQPADIRIRIKHQRTRQAVAAGFTAIDAIQYGGGLVDKDTVRFYLEGEFRSAINLTATPPAGFGLPQVSLTNLSPLGQPFAGVADSPAADKAYDVASTGIALTPTVAGPINATINGTYAYANGQTVTFYHTGVAGRQVRFAANGAGLSLGVDRVLAAPGDLLELRFDSRIAKWTEARFVSSTTWLPEASSPEMWAGTSSAKVVTPKKIYDMAAPVVLTDAATITPDFNAGINFAVTLAGNRTMASPVGAKPGQSGVVRVVQDATGGRTLTFGTLWKFPGGAASGGVLSTAANSVDLIAYFVGNDGNVYASLSKAYA